MKKRQSLHTKTLFAQNRMYRKFLSGREQRYSRTRFIDNRTRRYPFCQVRSAASPCAIPTYKLYFQEQIKQRIKKFTTFVEVLADRNRLFHFLYQGICPFAFCFHTLQQRPAAQTRLPIKAWCNTLHYNKNLSDTIYGKAGHSTCC